MAFVSKFACTVQYTVKNTFIDVTPTSSGRIRSSSAPPVASFTQVPVESSRVVEDLLDVVTAANSDEDVEDQLQRMSRSTITQMQNLAKKLNLKTSRWIRVVHSGYGSATWEDALRRSDVAWVAASKKPEGVYVHVPAELGKDGVCQALKQLNFAVRRDTYFRDMKRSNKSRLQFKEEIVVASSGTLVQEDASTSAGSESGSPVEAGSSEFDAVEQFLSALNSDFQAGPTVADAPATPHEMPGDSVLDYYQQPPQVRHMQRGDAHSSKHSHYRNHKEWSANAQFGYWRQETLTVPVYMCVGALR
jgi:hypothetical protein